MLIKNNMLRLITDSGLAFGLIVVPLQSTVWIWMCARVRMCWERVYSVLWHLERLRLEIRRNCDDEEGGWSLNEVSEFTVSSHYHHILKHPLVCVNTHTVTLHPTQLTTNTTTTACICRLLGTTGPLVNAGVNIIKIFWLYCCGIVQWHH